MDRIVYRLGVALTILRKAHSRGESGGSDVVLARWVRLSRMFTGLVQAMGVVDRVARSAEGARLAIDFGAWPLRPDLGASISVSGCCLTVVEVDGGVVAFDVIHRTLEMTTLGGLEPGDAVNLEPAATLQTALGGHLVQGHVDGVGRVVSVQEGDDWRVRIECGEEVAPHLVDRGSITVDGVSLTVAVVLRNDDGASRGFEIALIPETLERTTLRGLAIGDGVNLEADVISKMVAGHVDRVLADRRGS